MSIIHPTHLILLSKSLSHLSFLGMFMLGLPSCPFYPDAMVVPPMEVGLELQYLKFMEDISSCLWFKINLANRLMLGKVYPMVLANIIALFMDDCSPQIPRGGLKGLISQNWTMFQEFVC